MSIGAKLKNWAKRIKRDGVTLWFAGNHLATPWYAKALGVFVVDYALSPIDLIPERWPRKSAHCDRWKLCDNPSGSMPGKEAGRP